jgi:hypothetical protein
MSAFTRPDGIDRILAIHSRAERLAKQIVQRRERLARHYAAKAGYPKADGYLFHCLHNWTLGSGCESTNVFAVKAVSAWFRKFEGTSDFTQSVYRKAYAKYYTSKGGAK